MRRNFFGRLRVVLQLQKRMAVVGNDNIDVGSETPTRRPDRSVENSAQHNGSSEPWFDRSTPVKKEWPRICGAMSQQNGNSGRGNESTPQKLVQLVGCRDPKARPWVRPQPGPVKQ
jgi:hypothetical protein